MLTRCLVRERLAFEIKDSYLQPSRFLLGWGTAQRGMMLHRRDGSYFLPRRQVIYVKHLVWYLALSCSSINGGYY